MQIKRVIFIRAGETDWNKINRWQGWVASPLNEHGREQVTALASFLRNIRVGAIYSSDLCRAKDTAEIIASKVGYAPIYDERLRERNIGAWQGLTPDELAEWYPEQFKDWKADPAHYVIPNGESLNQVEARTIEVFEHILKDDKAETIGVVTHTVTIRSLLHKLIPDTDPTLKLANSSVTTIARNDDEWKLIAANDIFHLEGITSQPIRELGDKS